jgi:hypothetical protein
MVDARPGTDVLLAKSARLGKQIEALALTAFLASKLSSEKVQELRTHQVFFHHRRRSSLRCSTVQGRQRRV